MNDSEILSPNSLGEVLTIEEVAKVLKVSISSIRRMIKRKENPLPIVDLADKNSQKPQPRVLKSQLIEFLKSMEDPRRNI